MKNISGLFKVGLLSVLLFGFGCAHRSPHNSKNSDGAQDLESFRVSDPQPPAVSAGELSEIPVEMNGMVEKWINYFQGRGRGHMERYLSRSTRYAPSMKRILRQNGLPEDLIYIALIESGFSWKATSHASAVGYWQFIRGTGRRYGLEINALIDERRDPLLSTQAAAEYFKGLYSVFGSWYLAMASYNVGENRVKKEVMRNMTRDFWELARRKRLPKETINYVPKYIAAKLIGNNPEKYGFTNIDYLPPVEFDVIHVDKSVNLKQIAEKMSWDYDEFKYLNPKYRGEVAPVQGGKLSLRIPVGQKEQALQAALSSVVEKVEFVADAGETKTYRVRSGDSLYNIARKHGTTVGWLRDVNDLKSGRKLRIGQRLQVPDRSGKARSKSVQVAKVEKVEKEKLEKEKTAQDESAVQSPEVVTKKGVFYIVQPGDTLSNIAEDYGSTVLELRRMNNLGRKSLIKVGMRLKVPKDEGLPTDPNGKVAKQPREDEEETSDSSSESSSNSAKTHVVAPGENLSTIAKKYGVSVQEIQKANNLSRRSLIKVGSRLIIPQEEGQATNKNNETGAKSRVPTKKFHVVKKGENLHMIADRYGMTVQTLKKKNNLRSPSNILIGARLKVH